MSVLRTNGPLVLGSSEDVFKFKFFASDNKETSKGSISWFFEARPLLRTCLKTLTEFSQKGHFLELISHRSYLFPVFL